MIVVGELINATRHAVRKAVLNKDAEYIKKLAQSQVDAGADIIDINVGTGMGKEKELMQWAVRTVLDSVDVPLSIDSPDMDVLHAGLSECNTEKNNIINSVSAGKKRFQFGFEIARDFNASVICLLLGEDVNIVDIDSRFEQAQILYTAAKDAGIDDDKLFFDPLVFPVGTDINAPMDTLSLGKMLKKEFPETRLSMGLSNVSHGLPKRRLLNRVYLTLAYSYGFDMAIIDPTDKEIMHTLYAVRALSGHDEFCMEYIQELRAV